MQVRTLLWVLLAQAIGGVTPALTKLALAGLGPWSLVVARQLLGTGFLLTLLWLSSARTHPRARVAFRPRDWALLLLLAWAGYALPQILGALGLERSTATHGALLSPLEPIGILIGGALFLSEPLNGATLLAAALGVGGTALIVLSSGAMPEAGDLVGDLTMAAGHLAWAIYTLAAKPLLARHDPLRIAAASAALSPIPLLPLALAEPVDVARLLPSLGWIVLLAFLTTAVLTFAWNRALRDIAAGTMAIFIFVQPVVGLAVGALALGEPVTLQAVAGAALITAGVVFGAWRVRSA